MSISNQSLNRSPLQLLKYLGITGADSPNRVQDMVQGTVDLLPWWSASQEQFLRFSTAPGIAFVGFFPVVLVPANARWLVTRWSIRGVPAAAGTLAVTGAWDNVALGVEFAVGPQGESRTNPSISRVDCLAGLANPLLLGPNDRVGYICEVNTGAVGPSVLLDVSYTQFPA